MTTECGAFWAPDLLWTSDIVYDREHAAKKLGKQLTDHLSMRPSEYFDRNCFIGASNTRRRELARRYEIGVGNIMWGNDFPHPEGTWPHTREWLSKAFSDIPVDETQQILGSNAAECYHFDTEALRPLAARFGPTPEELGQRGDDLHKWEDLAAAGRPWLTGKEALDAPGGATDPLQRPCPRVFAGPEWPARRPCRISARQRAGLGHAGAVIEDFERCYIAVQSRDPRFDGWFFTAVTSTGIYCRPSCPAKTPMRANVRFYPSAAAAQRAGFRACKRCRPNATPGSPEWDIRADVVARAMRLIADGLVDREGVSALAARLGYSVRQLERLLSAEVGAGPIAIARAQRAQTARVLIETTSLPMADVAFAAGFSSIRQFNDTIRTVFASSPSHLRSRVAEVSDRTEGASTALILRLPFRQPLCPDNLFGHLAATAVPGVEEVRGLTYRRTLRLAHGPGIVELTPTPDHILCRAVLSDVRDLTATIARCRWLLDLDADPIAVDRHLARIPPSARSSTNRRVGGYRGASTAPSWPSGPCSASRCRRPPPAPTQPVWWRATGSRSPIRAAA